MKPILSQVALAPIRAIDSAGNAIFYGKPFGKNSGEFDAQDDKIHTWLNYINKCSPVPTHQLQNDTQRQEDVLYKMLQHYRLFDLKYEVSDFIKSISRYEPDYYTIKITSDFIDRIITKFKENHTLKLDENKK